MYRQLLQGGDSISRARAAVVLFVSRKIEIWKEKKKEDRCKKSHAESLSISITLGPLKSEDGAVRLESDINICRNQHTGFIHLSRIPAYLVYLLYLHSQHLNRPGEIASGWVL